MIRGFVRRESTGSASNSLYESLEKANFLDDQGSFCSNGSKRKQKTHPLTRTRAEPSNEMATGGYLPNNYMPRASSTGSESDGNLESALLHSDPEDYSQTWAPRTRSRSLDRSHPHGNSQRRILSKSLSELGVALPQPRRSRSLTRISPTKLTGKNGALPRRPSGTHLPAAVQVVPEVYSDFTPHTELHGQNVCRRKSRSGSKASINQSLLHSPAVAASIQTSGSLHKTRSRSQGPVSDLERNRGRRSYRKEIRSLRAENQKLCDENNLLQAQLLEMSHQVKSKDQLQSTALTVNSRIEGDIMSNEEPTRKNSSGRIDAIRALSNVAPKQKESLALQKDRRISERQKVEKLKSKVKQMKTQQAKQEVDLLRLGKELSTHETEVEGLQRELTRSLVSMEELEEEHAADKTKIVKLNKQLADALEKVGSLTKECSEKNTQIEQIKREMDMKNNEVQTFLDSLESKIELIVKLELELETVSEELAESEENRVELKRTYEAKLERSLNESKRMQREIIDLEGENAALTKKVAILSEDAPMEPEPKTQTETNDGTKTLESVQTHVIEKTDSEEAFAVDKTIQVDICRKATDDGVQSLESAEVYATDKSGSKEAPTVESTFLVEVCQKCDISQPAISNKNNDLKMLMIDVSKEHHMNQLVHSDMFSVGKTEAKIDFDPIAHSV